MDILLDILTRDQQGWVALVIAMLSIGYLLFRSRFRKKDPLEKAPFSSLSSQRSVERQMQGLLVELSDMTRQMNAQIDTRSAKLEQLIREADQRIQTLRELGGESPAQALPKPVKPLPVIPIEPHEDVSPAPVAETEDARHAEIYSLADQGRDAREIAKRLNRPAGEVELILALRQRV